MHVQSGMAAELWEKTLVENSRLSNAIGNPIGNKISINQQILIMSDLKNAQDRIQEFIYIVQIKDSNQRIVYLSWFAGSLSEFQSLNASLSWTPHEGGEFTVEIFVWDGLKKQVPLSTVRTIGVIVS